MIHRVFDIYGFIILAAAFIILFIAENIFVLRRRVERKVKRVIINTILSFPAFALLRLMVIPVTVWLAAKNESWHIGLNALFDLPLWSENIIAFLLLDYSIYWWHIILHRLPLMWRFHIVHHTDLDMDVTTAFRFHFGEMLGTVLFRSVIILLIGASPLIVLIYEIAFEVETQFHHSNTRLPLNFEKCLNKMVVTPRMHGIHHSVIKAETDSNYASVFSCWDRLHKTIRLNIHQSDVTIGVPVYHDEAKLTVGNLLKLPFTKIKAWENKQRYAGNDVDELKD